MQSATGSFVPDPPSSLGLTYERGCFAYRSRPARILFSSDGPRHSWWLSNGILAYTKVGEEATADVTLTTSTSKLPGIVRGFDSAKFKEIGIDVSGNSSAFDRLCALLDLGDPKFNIVTP